MEMDVASTVLAKVDALARQVNQMSTSHQQSAAVEPIYEEGTNTAYVDYVGSSSHPQNNPYSNTYNPGWRNHPNFSWNNNNVQRGNSNPPPGFQRTSNQPPKSSVEEMLAKLVKDSEERNKSLDIILKNQDTTLRNHEASIKNLETQVGQIAKLLSERPQGSLPGNTEVNPREQVNVVILKGKNEGKSDPIRSHGEKVVEKTANFCEEGHEGREKPLKVKEYTPRIPYPACLNRPYIAERCKLSKLFDRLHLPLSFDVVASQMSKHAKCLGELLSTSMKLKEVPKTAEIKKVPAIVQEKAPKKLSDPGGFIIPCVIGDVFFDRALADAGASVSVMPYKLFQKIAPGTLKQTHMCLQFADRSIKSPKGIVEDVLVRVGHLTFLVDFMIVDMEEDAEVPIILGRPFLATSQALMDMKERKLILRAGEEELMIKTSSIKKEHSAPNAAHALSIELKLMTKKKGNKLTHKDKKELCLTAKKEKKMNSIKVVKPSIQMQGQGYEQGLTKMGFEVVTRSHDPGDKTQSAAKMEFKLHSIDPWI